MKMVCICKATERLPVELREKIGLRVRDSSVGVIRKHAKEMMKRIPQRNERIALRYYETKIMELEEPVLIVNGKWKWKFNYHFQYRKKIQTILSNPSYEFVNNLPFKNPKYKKEYNFPNYFVRVVPCISRHMFFD